jgi:hypothetical protein
MAHKTVAEPRIHWRELKHYEEEMYMQMPFSMGIPH